MFYDLDRNQYGNDCRAEGRAEGRIEGRAEGRNEILHRLILKGNLSDEELADAAGVSLEEIRQLREELTATKTA